MLLDPDPVARQQTANMILAVLQGFYGFKETNIVRFANVLMYVQDLISGVGYNEVYKCTVILFFDKYHGL